MVEKAVRRWRGSFACFVSRWPLFRSLSFKMVIAVIPQIVLSVFVQEYHRSIPSFWVELPSLGLIVLEKNKSKDKTRIEVENFRLCGGSWTCLIYSRTPVHWGLLLLLYGTPKDAIVCFRIQKQKFSENAAKILQGGMMLQHLECKKIKKKDRRLNILLQCPSRRGVRLDKSEIRCAHIVPFSFNCKHLYYIFRSGMYRTLVMSSQGGGYSTPRSRTLRWGTLWRVAQSHIHIISHRVRKSEVAGDVSALEHIFLFSTSPVRRF